MNTLGYVSRQFDGLAAPKTPPRTPIKRVSSWSTRSLLFNSARRPPRSQSSPDIPSTSPSPPPPQLPPPPPQLVDSLHIESVIDHIFFIRVVVLFWEHIKHAWSSLRATQKHPAAPPTIELSSPDSSPPSTPSTSPPPTVASRSATPSLPARKTPFHMPKTLVLDLDETLIHSTSRPIPYQQGGSGLLGLGSWGKGNKAAGHMVEVVLGGRSTLYHVYKRPFVDFFLRTVSGWYTLVIFTASMQEYADPVIDWLDAGRGILAQRFFRDSCTQLPNGSYTKDLTVIEADLSRVCLVDNSPVSYTVNESNGIPIEGWTSDPSDEALLDLLPVLDSLRFTSDVRRVLGLRKMGAYIIDTDS